MRPQAQNPGVRPSLPVVLTLDERIRENPETFTLYFPLPGPYAVRRGLDVASFVPGQFFMVWLPRMDEKPYAVSHVGQRRLAITVQRRGPFSERLCDAQPGTRVGLRGPFGRGFWLYESLADSDRVALVGGGCGMAVMAPLAERLPLAHVVQGARTADGLLFRERFPGQIIFTDDGSAGREGFPTRWLQEQTARGGLDMVYTCGPELMMAQVARICREAGVACQVCMERYMKCGIGVCGQCDCDGKRVCLEGPVFDLEDLAGMPSFGVRRRDRTGRTIPVTVEEQCPTGPVTEDKPAE